jgi:hypothetical protein
MSRRELLFTALLGVAAVTHSLEAVRGGEGVDFFHYWMVPHLFRAGEGAGVYDADGSERLRARLAESLRRESPRDPHRDRAASYWDEFQVTNTPFCYLILSPFATRDFATGYFAFQYVSLACLAGGILGFGRLSGLSWLDGVVAAAAATFCFECVASDVRVGNLNRILLGWVAAATWAASHVGDRRWGVVAGLLCGLAACFKPIVAIVCLVVPAYRLATGDRRRAVDEGIGIAIGVAVGVAVPMLLVDRGIWQAWLARVGSFDWLTHSRVAAGNVSLVELVIEKGGLDLALPLLAALLGLVGAGLFALRGRAERATTGAPPTTTPVDASGLVAAMSLGLLAYLLAARLVWLHYYVLAIPALLFLAGRIRRGRPAWFVIAATIAGLAIAVKPVLQATAVYDPYVTMGVMVVGGWLAFGLVLRELVLVGEPCGA